MNNEELYDWLLTKLLSCYPVKIVGKDNYVYWYYDEMFIRKLKVSKLNNKKIKYPNKITGFCLFEQDIENKELLLDKEILDVFYKNYSQDFQDVKFIITDILKYSKFDSYTIESNPIKFNSNSNWVFNSTLKFRFNSNKRKILSKKELKRKIKEIKLKRNLIKSLKRTLKRSLTLKHNSPSSKLHINTNILLNIYANMSTYSLNIPIGINDEDLNNAYVPTSNE
jgi:hypothetical protein